MHTNTHILVIRLSAIGDVAMTVPVIKALATQYPNINITILTQPFLKPLFKQLPQNVHFMEADIKNKHKNIQGLNQLFRRIHAKHFTHIADLHDVLRTKYLRARLHINNYKIAHINKHRKQRKLLTRSHNKQLQPLHTQYQNYADVFQKLGFPIQLEQQPNVQSVAVSQQPNTPTQTQPVNIGIAPFAAHKGKIYPLHLMQQVVEQLNKQPHIQNIYFFCGKGQETHIINKWCSKYNKCNNASQQLKSIEKELQLMAKLRLLITMDSANAHLAAIAGTEVITIWGATHPYAGFKAYNQKDENIIQAQLPCRPCSIYGNKPCQRQDYACLNNIQPQQIIDKIMHNINNNT